MERFAIFLLACTFALLASSLASAAIVKHSFKVQNLRVRKLGRDQVITVVNGRLPGPTIVVREGDTLLVHVLNKSPYPITIHWHGVFQFLSAWADGPEYVTQCPIQPEQSYTYRFNITGQEGTLWWHAHSSWLRATVYGALIILPKSGRSYPFPKPHREIPVLLGEWWDANIVDIVRDALASGGAPQISDAYTINGKPGNLYPCSQNDMYKLRVEQGKTYMLRIVNAALNNQLFFKIAKHKMKVVAIDAAYTKPYLTDVIVIGPGQTIDVVFTADQYIRSYYMAARPYYSVSLNLPFDSTTTRSVIVYKGSRSRHSSVMPVLPYFHDTPTAHKFFTSLTALRGGRHWVPVPRHVDERMFIAFGMNLEPCPYATTCLGPQGTMFSASMNNESFVFPKKTSILEAFFHNKSGVYTTDFPDNPPLKFDYTNPSINFDESLIFARKSTKVKKVQFNSTVEMVFQDTALLAVESHPLHLHGYNFHVLAQGFGNYDAAKDRNKFNLVDAPIRNTVSVPVGGWTVIRFKANNPGIWLFHCHLDLHSSIGMTMAFEVENGPTLSSTLPPPPFDLPKC
ncbi:hypothetical protein UlMin_000348 [Ulmus minor]